MLTAVAGEQRDFQAHLKVQEGAGVRGLSWVFMTLKGWAHMKVPRHGLNLTKRSDSLAFHISLPGCGADKGEGWIRLESCYQSDIKRQHHPLSQFRGCRFLDTGRVMTDNKTKGSLGGYHMLHTHTIYRHLTECCNNPDSTCIGFSLRKKLGDL